MRSTHLRFSDVRDRPISDLLEGGLEFCSPVTWLTHHNMMMGITHSKYQTYDVDWATFEQVNKQTGKRRAIRRLLDGKVTHPSSKGTEADGMSNNPTMGKPIPTVAGEWTPLEASSLSPSYLRSEPGTGTLQPPSPQVGLGDRAHLVLGIRQTAANSYRHPPPTSRQPPPTAANRPQPHWNSSPGSLRVTSSGSTTAPSMSPSSATHR